MANKYLFISICFYIIFFLKQLIYFLKKNIQINKYFIINFFLIITSLLNHGFTNIYFVWFDRIYCLFLIFYNYYFLLNQTKYKKKDKNIIEFLYLLSFCLYFLSKVCIENRVYFHLVYHFCGFTIYTKIYYIKYSNHNLNV